MGKNVLFAVLIAGATAASALAFDGKVVTVPDEQTEAESVIKDWLDSRGLDCEQKSHALVFTKDKIALTIYPLVSKKEIDRLIVVCEYAPSEEYKDTKELESFASNLNSSQNFFKVFINKQGDLIVQGNLTFYDELTAREFDSYTDAYILNLRQYVLNKKGLKYLK